MCSIRKLNNYFTKPKAHNDFSSEIHPGHSVCIPDVEPSGTLIVFCLLDVFSSKPQISDIRGKMHRY